jgi:hypothetical protein
MQSFDPRKPARGLGDSIAKFTHAFGIDKLADKVAKLLGEEDCGCDRRREALNKLIPYKDYAPATLTEYEFLADYKDYSKGEVVCIDALHYLYPELKQLLEQEILKVK